MFVFKLSNTGTVLNYSTFIGGGGKELKTEKGAVQFAARGVHASYRGTPAPAVRFNSH